MFPCSMCGRPNPFAVRFCRHCGIRITPTAIATAMAADEVDRRGQQLMTRGLDAVTIGGFLLIVSLVVWFGLVPPEPVAELPPPSLGGLVPETRPGNQTTVPEVQITSGRLVSRAVLAPSTLSGIGADQNAVADWIATVAGSIRENGSCGAGADPLAATGLAALALQAVPTETALVQSSRARAWLKARIRDLDRQQPLGRTLALLALIDAEEMPMAMRHQQLPYLIDGKAPVWQAWGQVLSPPQERSTPDILVRKALEDHRLAALCALLEGRIPGIDHGDFTSGAATAILGGEERMLWAFLAWHLHPAPGDFRATMADWTQSRPAEVDPALVRACGSQAPVCVGLLTVGAPLRLPPDWATGIE